MPATDQFPATLYVTKESDANDKDNYWFMSHEDPALAVEPGRTAVLGVYALTGYQRVTVEAKVTQELIPLPATPDAPPTG